MIDIDKIKKSDITSLKLHFSNIIHAFLIYRIPNSQTVQFNTSINTLLIVQIEGHVLHYIKH